MTEAYSRFAKAGPRITSEPTPAPALPRGTRLLAIACAFLLGTAALVASIPEVTR